LKKENTDAICRQICALAKSHDLSITREMLRGISLKALRTALKAIDKGNIPSILIERFPNIFPNIPLSYNQAGIPWPEPTIIGDRVMSKCKKIASDKPPAGQSDHFIPCPRCLTGLWPHEANTGRCLACGEPLGET